VLYERQWLLGDEWGIGYEQRSRILRIQGPIAYFHAINTKEATKGMEENYRNSGESTGHVARMGEDRGVHRVLVGRLRERYHWGDQDVDGRIILRWIFRKVGGGSWGLDGVGSG
jgi:hypothetical protein